MSEISNKTLVSLLVVAIVISLAGTFLSLNKLGQLRSITGFASNTTTQSGITSVQILGTAQLTLYNGTMNFGSGQVNGSYSGVHDFCSLSSNGTMNTAGNTFSAGAGTRSGACDGFYIPNSFIIENTGNVNFADVNMSTTGGANDFRANFTSSVTNGTWQYNISEEAGGACSLHTGTWTEVINSSIGICTTFAYTPSSADAIMIRMNISLPEDAAPQAWNDTVTFTGYV